jgi:membrane-bound lytic murein transglycosylase F
MRRYIGNKKIHTFCLVWFVLTILIGCESSESTAQNKNAESAADLNFISVTESYIETGGLEQIKQRGMLRILLSPSAETNDYLPRKGFPSHFEVELANKFAGEQELKPVFIYADSREDLIPLLLEGKADLIAANLTVTADRKKKIAFTVPVTTVREQIVTRNADAIAGPNGLAGRKVALHRSSSFWQTMQGLKEKNPAIQLQVVPEQVPTMAILEGVADEDYDLAVADSNLVNAVMTYREELTPAFDLTGERPIAWGVRPEAEKLLEALNRFLTKEGLTGKHKPVYIADLPGIKKRKVLRVLTRNNAATYFLWRGEFLGFEYELVREFAKKQGLRLEMIVPPSRENLIPWLLEGKGDIVAASLTRSGQHQKQGVVLSRKYNTVSEVLVRRTNDNTLNRPEDLAGRTVVVRRSSSYWATMSALKESGIDLNLQAAPEDLETEEIIDRVASGEYDLTVADSHILDIELTWREHVDAAFALGDPVTHGFAMRADDKALQSAVNKFLKTEYRGLFYNITYKKYFKNPHKIRKHVALRVDGQEDNGLSPYDDVVRTYAAQYGFDWRLIVAQMYQESRFDPLAKSWVGALGLMQVMPRTAQQFGFSDLQNPEVGLQAGVRYLDWLQERFDSELPVQDRMWFALASYNAGVGHVRDARRLARKMGWNHNRWFGNVERAMLLLSKRKYARQARHGYVRGSEPVKYVREIRNRFNAYVQLTENI